MTKIEIQTQLNAVAKLIQDRIVSGKVTSGHQANNNCLIQQLTYWQDRLQGQEWWNVK